MEKKMKHHTLRHCLWLLVLLFATAGGQVGIT